MEKFVKISKTKAAFMDQSTTIFNCSDQKAAIELLNKYEENTRSTFCHRILESEMIFKFPVIIWSAGSEQNFDVLQSHESGVFVESSNRFIIFITNKRRYFSFKIIRNIRFNRIISKYAR